MTYATVEHTYTHTYTRSKSGFNIERDEVNRISALRKAGKFRGACFLLLLLLLGILFRLQN